MSLKSMGFLVVVLTSAAAPALAAGPDVPITTGSNDGSIVVNGFNFVPAVVTHYSGPVVDTQAVSTSAPPNLTPGTSTVTGSITIANTPTPGIDTSGQVLLTGLAGANLSVQDITHYSFRIDAAPGGPLQAQVFVNANGNVGFSPGSVWGPASTFAAFRVQQQFNGPIIIDDELNLVSSAAGTFVDEFNDPTHATTNSTLSFTVAQNFSFLTNTIYDVTLQASMGGTVISTSGVLSESLFANIDPMFTVAGPFTIDISPGFGGVTLAAPAGGVPEPAAWALMLLGFAGLGGALRSRRRVAA
jgi:hypothetical protein